MRPVSELIIAASLADYAIAVVNLGHRRTDEKRGVDHHVAMYRRLDAFDPNRDWLSALLLGLAALAVPLSVAIRGFLLWLQS